MTEFVFEAKTRTEIGGSASRQLRSAGSIPAVVYGAKQEPQSITLDHNQFINKIKDETVYTSILKLNIDGKESRTVIKDIHRHPYANKILHIDFQRIDDKSYITKAVPLKALNAERSPGVRLGALLTLLQPTVQVRCLPKDLPLEITVDCAKMEASTTLKMSQLKMPEGVQLVSLLSGAVDQDHAIIMVGKAR